MHPTLYGVLIVVAAFLSYLPIFSNHLAAATFLARLQMDNFNGDIILIISTIFLYRPRLMEVNVYQIDMLSLAYQASSPNSSFFSSPKLTSPSNSTLFSSPRLIMASVCFLLISQLAMVLSPNSLFFYPVNQECYYLSNHPSPLNQGLKGHCMTTGYYCRP